MKNKMMFLVAFSVSALMAHAQTDFGKMSSGNTWLKLGVNAALPIADLAETHTAGIGLDLGIQFLETKANGIGLKVGLINYFGKENIDDAVVIPLAAMWRYYPKSVGLFLGMEAGYAFVSGLPGTTGGAFVRPQIGLHYYDWNFFGYYDYIAKGETSSDLQAIGIGITYNLRFK